MTLPVLYVKINCMKKEYLECARICSAHGVRGLVKVESWCDSPKVLQSLKRVFASEGEGYRELKVISASVMGSTVLMNIEGINTREEAIASKNKILYLKRSDLKLKEGTVFVADMIGLPVIDVDTGRVYGEISDVTDVPRGKLYTIKTSGGEVLFPDVPEFVKKIDCDKGVFIHAIEGFFDEEI